MVTFAVALAVLLHPPSLPGSWGSVAPVGLLNSCGLLPSVLWAMPVLIVALVAGLGYALIAPRPPRVTGAAFTAGHVILGAAIGSRLDLGSIRSLRADWLAVLASCSAILVLCVAAGYVLCLKNGIHTATGVLAMVGRAPSLIATARTLGADDRVVTAVQYLRVLIIVAGMPFVINELFKFDAGASGEGILIWVDDEPLPTEKLLGALRDAAPGLVLVTLAFLIGVPLARRVPLPAGTLIFPLIVTALLTGTSLLDASVPNTLASTGSALIGLQVGLRFTRDNLRALGSLLPLAIVTIVGLVALSAGPGLVLAQVTGHTLIDGYLATSPGGLYPVLAAAVSSDSDVTFVLTVQIARHIVILLSIPLLTQLISRRESPLVE